MSGEKILRTKKDFDEFLYKDPYFAFLDILGFSELVKKNIHDKLEDVYKNIFAETVTKVDEMISAIRKSKSEKEGEGYTDSGLRIINISDSILIWTQHGQPLALFELVFAVSTLLGISLIRGLPLRGSITRQKFSVLENGSVTSIIGRGLVHAYEQEKIQQWSGCVIDGEIIDYFRGIEKIIGRWERPAPIERDELIYEYDIPIYDSESKKFITKKGYAVNWSEPYITDQMISESFDMHNKKDEREGSTTPLKIKNTLEFHNFCKNKRREKEMAFERLRELLDKTEKGSST